VRAVIRARLDRLSPNALALLAAAAVLEHDVTFERLGAVADLPDAAGLPALDELLSSRMLLEAAQPGGASGYAFVNDMFRARLRNLLQQRYWHKSAVHRDRRRRVRQPGRPRE
jgi:hypothetical protein